jgi:hypothetical protein
VWVSGTLKFVWHGVLTEYKLKHYEQSSLNKSDFPACLRSRTWAVSFCCFWEVWASPTGLWPRQ